MNKIGKLVAIYLIWMNKLAFLTEGKHTKLFYIWNECTRSLQLKF